MSGAPLNLILDVIILVLLGMTIVYAARLSLQLKRLRDSKADMDKIVRELVRNIDKAERAVVLLRDSADEQGQKLQRIIGNAVSLTDELQLMTDSGDRLATRLEKLVESVSPITRDAQARMDALVEQADAQEAYAASPAQRAAAPKPAPAKVAPQAPRNDAKAYTDHLRKLDADDDSIVPNMFAIRDPEVERGLDPLAMDDDPSLYSEAERDLFRALKGLKN